ncbi:MAG: hypothetical protein AB4080_00090 [Trichodesmium sp.]
MFQLGAETISLNQILAIALTIIALWIAVISCPDKSVIKKLAPL